MVIDKVKLARILKGTALPATATFFSPKSSYWEDSVAWEHNPEQVKAMVYDQYVTQTNPGPAAMMIYAWEDAHGHGSFIADAAFTSGAIENACCNYSRISSPDLDALVAKGHDGDLAVSEQAYKDVARYIVRDQAASVPLLYPVRCELANKRVKNYQTAVYPSGQSKRFEIYWIEE